MKSGELVQYSVTFNNKSQKTMANAQLTCNLDAGVYEKIGVNDNGFLDSNGMPTWNFKGIQPGQKVVVTFKGIVIKDLPPEAAITSQAFLSADGLPLLISDNPATPQFRDYTIVKTVYQNASLTGRVVHQQYGTPISATVALTGTADLTTKTDTKGAYSFGDVIPGPYTVKMIAEGFDYVVPDGPKALNVGGQGENYIVDFFLAHSDTRAPRSAFSLTPDEMVKTNASVLNGSAHDHREGSGISKVEVCLQRNNDGLFWSGDKWVVSETWLQAKGTTDWSCELGSIVWDVSDSYLVQSKATDRAGNIEHPSANTTAPQKPELISPSDKATVNTLQPTFKWQAESACRYIFQVDNDTDFFSPVIHDPEYFDQTTYTPGSSLSQGTYFWRVQAVSISGIASEWSDVWQVEISLVVDKDKDGIDDAWEIKYFGSIEKCDRYADPEGDGYSNGQEYENQLNGEKDPQGNTYHPTEKNAPFGTGYQEPDEILLMIIPAITSQGKKGP